MKIYTRTGDDGSTGLFGGGRVSKSTLRIAAYGTVDEGNSVIGMARAWLAEEPGHSELEPVLSRIQADLFVLGADLATPHEARPSVPRIAPAHVTHLEGLIDRFDADLPLLKHFILPGGTHTASALHLARTVCRRAERLTVELAEHEEINHHAVVYLNRLSDLLFVLARWANFQAGAEEVAWEGA